MLFAYNDDGRLEVVENVSEARDNFAATDVEAGVIRLFDEAGRYMAPHFPERSERKFLGLKLSSDPGPFHLHPPTATAEQLLDELGPTIVVMPNRWFKDIDAVKAHLSKTG